MWHHVPYRGIRYKIVQCIKNKRWMSNIVIEIIWYDVMIHLDWQYWPSLIVFQ